MVAGRGQHERVAAVGDIRDPRGERFLQGGVVGAGGDPVVVEVEAEGFGVPVAQGEGGGGFGGQIA